MQTYRRLALIVTTVGLIVALMNSKPKEGYIYHTHSTLSYPTASQFRDEFVSKAKQVAEDIMPKTLSLRLEHAVATQAPCIFIGVASSGKAIWWAATSRALPHPTPGYAGPIDLLVGLDASGSITAVRILGHQETPTFVTGIDESWFLDQFVGKSLNDPIEPGVDFDGITHATITIKAIAADLREILRRFAAIQAQQANNGQITGNFSASTAMISLSTQTSISSDSVSHNANSRFIPRKVPPTSFLCMIASILLITISFRDRIPKIFIDFMIVLLLGVITQQFLSLSHLPMLFSWLRNGQTPPFQLLVYLGIATLAAISITRGYCRFLCPMGRLQDLIAFTFAHISNYMSSKKVGHRTSKDSSERSDLFLQTYQHQEPLSLCKVRPIGRFLVWGALAALALGLNPPLELTEVFTPLFLRRGGLWGLCLVAAALIGTAITPRFYCRGLCPLNPLFQDLETAKNMFIRRSESENKQQRDEQSTIMGNESEIDDMEEK